MTNLTFTQNDKGRYVTSFTSTGSPMAVQIQRETAGDLVFFANIGTLPKQVLQGLSKFYAGSNILRTINVPANVVITIESETTVTSGGYE